MATVSFTGPHLEELGEVQRGSIYSTMVEGADWQRKCLWFIQYKLVLTKLLASFGILRLLTAMCTTDKRSNKKTKLHLDGQKILIQYQAEMLIDAMEYTILLKHQETKREMRGGNFLQWCFCRCSSLCERNEAQKCWAFLLYAYLQPLWNELCLPEFQIHGITSNLR